MTTLRRHDTTGPLYFQVEHYGLAVIWKDGHWWTNLYVTELPEIDTPPEIEEPQPPKPLFYLYRVQNPNYPVRVPEIIELLPGARARIGNQYFYRDGEIDFTDHNLGIRVVRGAGDQRMLIVEAGNLTWRFYCTRHWRLSNLFGEAAGQWMIITPQYVPNTFAAPDRWWLKINSFTSKAIVLWVVFLLSVLFNIGGLIFFFCILACWTPESMDRRWLPTDIR